MWEKVLLNLLSNALKFTFDGTIGVRVRSEAGQAVVEVADTGCGVPAGEVPRLFERFRRIASARSRSNEGSGIGLALVRELVTLNGGTITAASEEGSGTIFTIRLPWAAITSWPRAAAASPGRRPVCRRSAGLAAREPARRWSSAPARGPRSGRPARAAGPAAARVLIADDNTDMRDYLRRLLEPGYDVSTAADGKAALAAARSDLAGSHRRGRDDARA